MAAWGSRSLTVVAIGYTFKIIVGPHMVVRCVGAHATDYVCADSRRFVTGPLPPQLIDDFLRGEGLAAGSSPDCWKDSEDLITSGHRESLYQSGLHRIARTCRVQLGPRTVGSRQSRSAR